MTREGREECAEATALLKPLDRARGLGRDVVRDAVDAGNLVRDARRDFAENRGREVEPVLHYGVGRKISTQTRRIVSRRTHGGHEVVGGDGPEGDDLVVRALVTSDTDGLDREQSGKSLRDLVIEAGGPNLLDVNGVGLLKEGDLVARDGTDDADGKTRSGEGVAANEVLGNLQQAAEVADLV